jgi:hypothetical protein
MTPHGRPVSDAVGRALPELYPDDLATSLEIGCSGRNRGITPALLGAGIGDYLVKKFTAISVYCFHRASLFRPRRNYG